MILKIWFQGNFKRIFHFWVAFCRRNFSYHFSSHFQQFTSLENNSQVLTETASIKQTKNIDTKTNDRLAAATYQRELKWKWNMLACLCSRSCSLSCSLTNMFGLLICFDRLRRMFNDCVHCIVSGYQFIYLSLSAHFTINLIWTHQFDVHKSLNMFGYQTMKCLRLNQQIIYFSFAN